MRIVPAMEGTTILFTVDGSVPTSGAPSTYTCGVNAPVVSTNVSAENSSSSDDQDGEGEEEQEEQEVRDKGVDGLVQLAGRAGKEPRARRLLEYGRGREGVSKPRHASWQGGHGVGSRHKQMLVTGSSTNANALQGITSAVTVEGCLVTMPPGSYVFNAVAVSPGEPCVGCPPYTPSRVVSSGLYSVEPPPSPTDACQPKLTWWIEGPHRNVDAFKHIVRRDWRVDKGEPTEPVHDAVVLRGRDRLYVQVECKKGLVPRYTVNDPSATVTPYSFLTSEQRWAYIARFELPVGHQTVHGVCYQGVGKASQACSTVSESKFWVIKRPRPPQCSDEGKAFTNVESATVRIEKGRAQGDLRYIIDGQQETCPRVGNEQFCDVYLSADACRQPNVSIATLSRLGVDENVPVRRLLAAPREQLQLMRTEEPCNYQITAYVDSNLPSPWTELGRSREVNCSYSVAGPVRSDPPTFSLPPGVYNVPDNGHLDLTIRCADSSTDWPRVGINEVATKRSSREGRRRLNPGITTVNAICWSSFPRSRPSAMVTGVYEVRQQAPALSCSQPSRKVFEGNDQGVRITLTDTSHSTVFYTLRQPGEDGSAQGAPRAVDCGASVCHIFLPSFCPHPMQESDASTIRAFGRFYPDGCAYEITAWAESPSRARGPEFKGNYLVVPNPVAAGPVFTTAIRGSAVQVSPGDFIVAPGATVNLILTCGTAGTQPRYVTGATSEPSQLGPSRTRISLQPGSQVYRARCFGRHARPSPVTEGNFTIVVRATAPEAREPNGTEFLGGAGAEPQAHLYVKGASREGDIEWSVTGYGMWPGVVDDFAPYEVRTGSCAGTSSSCKVLLSVPDCRPWELDETSCYVTVTAKTVMQGALQSDSASWTYLITPPPPVNPPRFDPEPLSEAFIEGFGEGIPVKIICEPGTEPRYTRDGQAPTQFSTHYTGPVTVKRGVTDLQAICVRDGVLGGSGVSHAKFRVVTKSPEDVGRCMPKEPYAGAL